MKKIFYIAMLAGLLFGCGVKKGVVNQEQAQTERAVVVDSVSTPSDSLPEFLREFANDSTIHIYWVEGVPFIIDDSVPMLLPPIDKNPEEYVCKHVKASYYSRMTPETVSAIIDSVPWVNKCINSAKDFLLSHPEIAEPYHSYTYRVNLLKNNQQKIIEFRVFQEPVWTCFHTPLYRSVYSYYLDSTGILLGKCALKMPYRLIYEHQLEYPTRSNLPKFSDFEKKLNSVFSNYTLLRFYVDIVPTPCPRDD